MTSETEPGRFRSLDGLRGVAALAVVFHHLVLMTPGIPNGLWPQRDSATISVLWRGVTFPLHLALSAGLEAVFVFFVLSGFVLTLPALRAGAFSWPQYYVRRVLRLGLPVLGSIALAVVLLLLVPRYPVDRELVLMRVNITPETRAEVMQICDVFRAKIVDVQIKNLSIEVTGNESKVQKFIMLMENFGISDLTRTGKIALARRAD